MERRDPLMTELEAMAVISRLLETLPDAEARQRVLRWAAERVGAEIVASSAVVDPTKPAVNVADDPALELDSLDDMFGKPVGVEDDLSVVVDERIAATPDPSKLPVADVLRSFAAEFQRFAEEWTGATA